MHFKTEEFFHQNGVMHRIIYANFSVLKTIKKRVTLSYLRKIGHCEVRTIPFYFNESIYVPTGFYIVIFFLLALVSNFSIPIFIQVHPQFNRK